MAEISKLLEIFAGSKAPRDIPQRFQSASIRPGLERFLSILESGIADSDDGRLGFEAWSRSQIEAVGMVARLLVSATLSTPVERGVRTIVAIVEKSLEFALCFMEKSAFDGVDFSLQNDFTRLIEISLSDGACKENDATYHDPENAYVGLLSVIPIKPESEKPQKVAICNMQGTNCLKDGNTVDKIIKTLSSACLEADSLVTQLVESPVPCSSDRMMSMAQHWAAVHLQCIPRLIMICKRLLCLPVSFEQIEDANLCWKLSFCQRIFRLSGHLAREISHDTLDMDILCAIASCADIFPTLFSLRIEYQKFDSAEVNNLGSHLLLALEEFFHFVQIIFMDSYLSRNIHTCLLASMLDNLNAMVWRYDTSESTPRPPLVYWPQIVVHLLKLLKDTKSWTCHMTHIHDQMDNCGNEPSNFCCDSETRNISCHISSEKVLLLKKYTCEEYLRMMFPPSKQWVDDLIHLAFFLYAEGLRLRPKVDRQRQSCTKAAVVSELDGAISHEDEAIFGDLFSEGSRPSGSSDGLDQSINAISGVSSGHLLPIQAAAELLGFLKENIFSVEWHSTVFDDACKKIDGKHVSLLLSMLSCQNSVSDERNFEDCATSPSQRALLNVSEICFKLLHKLLISHAFSPSLKEYLVDQVLKVVDGAYNYNNYTLTLLAHALISRLGLDGSRVTIKIFEGYVDFIMEKAKSIYTNCPESNDFFVTLPSAFHLEILLMAFHLSNAAEKVTLTNHLFSSLQGINVPTSGMNSRELFCWALIVSRLILVLRHIVVYPSSCPSWLLMRLKTRLRETPSRALFIRPLNDHVFSWTSIVVESVFGDSTKESPSVSGLLPLLIDVIPHPLAICKDDYSLDSLGLNWGDISSMFSWILNFWRGKKAELVEQLILERYIFLLCWGTIASIIPGVYHLLSVSALLDPGISNTESLFNFGLIMLSSTQARNENINLSKVIFTLLQRLLPDQLPDKIAVQGWDFLRNGSWLSLILSSLRAGIWKYSVEHGIPGVGLHCIQQSEDSEFFCTAEEMICSIIEGNESGLLVRLLSSVLRMYLQVFQEAFLSMVDCNKTFSERLSPLLLLKHTRFDKCRQGFLLEKCGFTPSQLESVCNVLLKLDEVLAKEDTTATNRIFLESMLHGFPSHLDSSSATFLTCVLVIKEVVCTLDNYIKVDKGNLSIGTDVLCQLLESILTIRSDKIFQTIHIECEAIFASLTAGKELLGINELYSLKQIEGILLDVDTKEIIDTELHEMLISSVVDSIDAIRRDDSKEEAFRYYVGSDESVSEEANEFFRQQHGEMLIFIDALDKCYSEDVSLKVLNLFVDLLVGGHCPGLKEKLQKKLLGMDVVCLSHWLEVRLLGCRTESSGAIISAEGSSALLRESTMDLITHLISQPCEKLSEELHIRLIEAMLMSLDSAFLLYDLHSARSYFSFVVQLLNGEPSLQLLVEKTLVLMDSLAGNENLLPGLKFLFGFLEAVLGDCGANKNTLEKVSSKLSSNTSFGSGSVISKPVSSRKHPENLVLPSNPESVSASIDCDATSADEDEDDGTSDGELGSMDKDVEEDSNSERMLASKVCTFTSSGSNFMEQHWYFCYTCDLTVSKGCCSICAKVCHRGHRVVYSRSSRFFCDCGAGGVRGSSCQCLKPRKFTGNNNASAQNTGFQQFLPFFENGNRIPDSDSDFDDGMCCVDVDTSFKLSVPRDLQDRLPVILENLDIEARVLELCNKLIPAVISRRELNLSKDKKVILGDRKTLSYKVDLFQLKKAYKSGSLDLKIKSDYPNSKDLKSQLASGSLTKSLLTVSVRGRLAAGEGDKVAIFDVGQLIGQPTVAPVTADKTNVKPLSKNIVRFEIVNLLFNPLIENYLAVSGYEDCQVLTVNPRGEVTDRLAIELALQGAYIRKVDWVPGSQVQLMVVTNMFVKIYDLSQDNISPMHYFTLSDDLIADAIFVPSSMGKVFLLVLSETGSLYRLEVLMEGDIVAKALTEIIQVQKWTVQPKGLSLYYSSTYRLVFLSYQDGTTLIGRLEANAMSFTVISAVYEDDQDSKVKPAGLRHWRELLPGCGVFVCFSNLNSNTALTVSIGSVELFAQNMRYSAGSALPLVGIAAYKPLSKDKTHCLVLHDDGSLQIYSYIPMGDDIAANLGANQTRKLGSNILNNKVYAGSNPEFPLDFFEKTTCITADVRLTCDILRPSDSESIKQLLASDDGFLESPTATGFKITVSNSNPDIVMVGLRVHVGNTSASYIPSEITIFQRVIKLDEAMRSWYDIPFTIAESLLADEEFTVTVGRTFDGSTMPRIDSLEIYGRAKDEFGWKEKMDAILDMEAHVLGANSSTTGVGKKYQIMQTAPIHEQVITDALRLLSKVYSLCRSQVLMEVEDGSSELNKLKCKNLLETIFQSDREPLLQSAACHVLQAVFPKKEIYYQMKDTLCLLGVVKSFPLLISRIGVGGVAAGWVIKEFTSQMHSVSKITLHRRSNMVTFLEIHGSGVVDGLMQILWGILDLERPDTQTINNIVIPSVELIYSYAECLALHGTDASGRSVAPAVALFKKLLFAPYEAVQTSSSLAISSRLLQVPFPKQTMLAADDVVENPANSHVPSNISASVGNAEVMIEEDTATSSVQFCCDGCSTVPILRRRWHCSICPDFDLCEACHEVLDADRLPPLHSRDHPMSAIPIEIDTGGDGREIHFAMENLNDAGLMQVAADISMQNYPSPIHVLETNEHAEFSSGSDQRIVSISASKRAVNSLLLRELVGELKGWMKSISGIRAIPIMQLFYRLSSAVGGPFMDSTKPENLDLEKFVKWFLEEINLGKPFLAKTRSSFGEVSILVFMFFTLMLRNWHQPGNDGTQSKAGLTAEFQDKPFVQFPLLSSSSSDSQEKDEFASQLVRACSYLRQQSFLSYLMDILQQLVHVFKSSSVNAEGGPLGGSGCGLLLSVRRELPAGNFSPFFSDSYAKAHRADLFMDYHKLLLENTFRLVYSMIRPEKQDKSVEKDKTYKIGAGKDLKLDGFQDVLCSYISNPHTTFVRRYARRLFLHLCGSKIHYYSLRDSWQFTNEMKKLYKLVNKSGGFQNPLPYERSSKLVKCLLSICEAAGARPRNWQKYCSKHTDLLPFLMTGIFSFTEESVIQALKLLNLAFYTGKDMGNTMQKTEGGDAGTSSNKSEAQPLNSKRRKGEDGAESGSEKSCYMEQGVEIFCDKDGSTLIRFLESFLLEWNSASVRNEAKCVLYGIWHHGKQSFKVAMLNALLQKVKVLPMYGQNIVEYIELMTWLLGKVPEGSMKQQETDLLSQCLTSDVINCIFGTLHSQNELLANHPNSRIYNTLSGLVEFDGYYLESEPCVACSCPEVPYSRMKLESLKSETKFTDNRIIVKCTGSYTIQTVTMNVHDARKSKSVKVLNLYYNNRPVADLSELKNNWSLWKRAKSCHLSFSQTELKVEFLIPITACNFMIELDSFYENLQASSLESLQCPRCSRSVTDKHGICSNCHENAYQCRQCRNINYENLDSFLCNECGYSKYGRFEFNFMAKPSFSFDNMENDEDMKKGLAAIESESENAHRRYQQLLGFKKPLLKLVSSIGEHEIDSQQKDTVQQMMVSLPGPSCKINRKIALLGVLYGEKCKAAFDSVSKSVQTLQGLRRVLMTYLHQKSSDAALPSLRYAVPRSSHNCYGCATTFVTQCMELLQVLSKHVNCKKRLVAAGILKELFENNIHQGPKTARVLARAVLCAFSEGEVSAVGELNTLIEKKVMYCLEHHRSMDIALATHEELLLLSETCAVVDEFWELRLRVAFQLLFSSIKLGAKHPAISEHIILPCLRIISQACTPPKSDVVEKEQATGKSISALQPKNDSSVNASATLTGLHGGSKSLSEQSDKQWDRSHKGQDIPLLSYSEWARGASYLDFVRRQYKVSQAIKVTSHRARQDPHKVEYLHLKYALKWKRRACRSVVKSDLSTFALGSWVSELILSACSQSIRSEVCALIGLLCPQNSSRQFQLLNLLMSLLPLTLSAGESAAEFFELFFKMIDSEATRLFLTVRGCLPIICRLITQEVGNIESQERSLNIDISQGFILHKLIELLSKFLEVPNIRTRFMRDELLSQVLEALLVIQGLIVQKTKLISDCNRLLKDLLDSLLLESTGNKRQFIRACISGLQIHAKEKKGRTSLFILEQLCNMICPSNPEPVFLLILNKAHTQEEFIRGSMTKNPYSSAEIGPLMRDVKNKICHQLDLLGLLEDDYGMELLVAGNIISLDLSVSQVYEQVWKKYQSQSQNTLSNASSPSSGGVTAGRDCPPMAVTYRLQGLDGEATEPMIKELEDEREESQDPEVEFAIAGSVRECGGLEIILSMIQRLCDELKSNQEELASVLHLLMYCCKIRENRRALLKLGALGLLLETARRAFSVDAMEPAEGILLIVESLTIEANESDFGMTQIVLTVTNEESGAGEQAKKIVLMFLERLCNPLSSKKLNKQQRNNEMVTRILPYLTYGEPAAMEALIQHFDPYLQDWSEFDHLQKEHQNNPKDENLAYQADKQRSVLENFVRVSESLKTSACGERLKDIILEKGIVKVAVSHLRGCFAVADQAGFKSSAEWAFGLKLPSVPLVLSMLRGLSKGHLATQRCIDEEGVLSLLHALEGVSGENEIGARAENLLDTLADKENNGDGFLAEKIHKLRHATRDEMRRRALRKREELLQGLGMRQELDSDGGRIVVSQPSIEGLEDVEEEEDGLACMVCREGYSLRPNDMLGVYSYSKRVNLGTSSSGSTRADCVYTTVSHFNIIHFQCHQEAKRADAALKNPKKEWEGATLRNNETLCNCIFPLRGPSVPLAQYVRCVDHYWDNLNGLGRADGSRLRLLTYDIVLMLARFATGASFSMDSKGGGKESNSRFLPFMIQMASYLIDQGSSNSQQQQQRRSMAKLVSAYLSLTTSDSPTRPSSSSLSPARTASGAPDETVQFMMVSSLLSESYEDWSQHRAAFLRRGIYHAYMQHNHGRSTDEDPADSGKLFPIVQPMLVYTGLVEQLQRFLKLGSSEDSGGDLERWEVVMKDKLVDMKEMVGFSEELLSWLEDMASSADLRESFDVMGALGDVISGGFARCEDFVRAAILAGKS